MSGRKKHPGKPYKREKGQFVLLPYSMLQHPNFLNLSSDSRAVLLDMHLGYHGHNNGEISYSVRQAAACLSSGSERAKRALDKLQNKKFIVCHKDSNFNLKLNKAREWEITHQPMNGHLASHLWKNQITVPD
jgi:hypothetical protein